MSVLRQAQDGRTMVHPPRLQAGKQAFAALVDAVGGQVPAERYSGKAQSRISAYGGPNTDAFAPIDVVVKLEGITHGSPGHPHVTRWLAREAGYLLVPKPGALPADRDWCGALGDAVADFNDVQERLLRALPGGVTAAELRQADIRGQIAEAQARLAQLDALAARALEDI